MVSSRPCSPTRPSIVCNTGYRAAARTGLYASCASQRGLARVLSDVVQGIDVDPTQALLDDIAAIEPIDAVELFPDGTPCLERLQARGIKMAVVSDAWPNLPELYEALGIRRFFEGYAISSLLGCSKPDPRMYAEGARVLNREVDRLLFVDDCDDLVQAAIDLGYRGVALLRSGKPPAYPVPWIASLDQLTLHLE